MEAALKCIKIPWNVVGNLKISHDMKSKIVLWSKYQLFIYENLTFQQFIKIEPDFEIEDVIVVHNILICLDCSGNLNIKTCDSFIILAQNIKCMYPFEDVETRYVSYLQFEQNKTKLLVHSFNQTDIGSEFVLEMPDEDWVAPGDTNILVCSYIKPECRKNVQNIFNIEETDSNFLLVIVSFDQRNIYAVLFPLRNTANNIQVSPTNLWAMLYKSNTDITDIKITMMKGISILVGLVGGSIIKIPLVLKNQKHEVHFLNTTIDKFEIVGNDIIYTDTLTLWKNDNIFSKSEPMFKQFFVRNVRDFCIVKHQVICITYSNLIYIFKISKSLSCVKPPDADYTCAVQMVTKSNYLHEIMEAVRKNEELQKKITEEKEYLMALSLSKRKDVMDSLIHVTASVFDDYRDIASKSLDLTLTDELSDYYDSESFYFLINIIVNQVQHKLNKLLSEVLGNIKIHITLFEHGILKTTSIQIKEQLTTKNFVISLKRKNRKINRMQVHVKIITSIPGKFDEKQRLWTILYQKCINLKAENFIDMKLSKNHTLLKGEEDSLDLLVYKRAQHLHSTEYKFKITDSIRQEWMLYVKLPNNSDINMEDILGLIIPHNSKVATLLKRLAKLSKSKNSLEFQINKELVKLNIEGGNLRVTCSDIIIASDIRNFFSNIIFNTFKEEFSKESINYKYHTTIKNWKTEIILKHKIMSKEEFTKILTHFLRNVYCIIPI